MQWQVNSNNLAVDRLQVRIPVLHIYLACLSTLNSQDISITCSKVGQNAKFKCEIFLDFKNYRLF